MVSFEVVMSNTNTVLAIYIASSKVGAVSHNIGQGVIMVSWDI